MFVRWKRKRLSTRKRWGREEHSLAAVLVESQRTDAGPRQRFVKHLGAIPESKLVHHYWLADFWRDVARALDSLGVDGAARASLEAQVSRRVPRPTEESLQRARQSMADATAALAASR